MPPPRGRTALYVVTTPSWRDLQTSDLVDCVERVEVLSSRSEAEVAMKRVGIAVTAIALVISAPAFAAGQTIPLATMTCKQFVDSSKDTIGVILTWMMGHLQDEDEP